MPTFFAATDGNNGTQQIDMNLTQCQPMMMPHEQADHPMAVNMDGILKSSASINGTTGAGSFPLQLPFEGEQHEHADDQPKYNIYVEYGASSDRHARQQTTMALDNVSGINAFCDTAATVSAADAMAFAMANDGTHNENNNNGNAASEEVDEIDTLKLAQHISQVHGKNISKKMSASSTIAEAFLALFYLFGFFFIIFLACLICRVLALFIIKI